MPEFGTFDLGRVIATAEGIKQMRRQSTFDTLREQALRQNMAQGEAQEVRAEKEFQSKMSADDALQRYYEAHAIETSEDPLTAAQEVAPHIIEQFDAKHGAGTFAQMPPEQIRKIAGFVKQRAGAVAKVGPQKGDLHLESIVGPNGKPILVPREMAVGQQPFSKGDGAPSSYEEFIRAQGDPKFAQFLRERRGQGLSVTLPDGTTISEGGEPFALPKTTQNKLGDSYTESIAGMQRLQSMVSSFDPKFLTYGGKFKGAWSGIKAKTPEVFGQLSPEDQQYLSRYQSWSSDTLDNLNRYVKDITGASMSVQEAERIKASIPNADDDPISFQSKLDTTMKRLALVAARSAYLLSNPAQSVGDISLDRMQAIITDRANTLYGGYLQQGLGEREARQKALDEARSQFGLGNGAAN